MIYRVPVPVLTYISCPVFQVCFWNAFFNEIDCNEGFVAAYFFIDLDLSEPLLEPHQ
jgi:hypothetical protein